MKNSVTDSLAKWKKGGHVGYLVIWNGRRKITFKKAKPRIPSLKGMDTLIEELMIDELDDYDAKYDMFCI